MKIGDIVIFIEEGKVTDPRNPVAPPNVEYPALVYRIYDMNYLGLYVFTNEGMRQMRMTKQIKEGETNGWRIQE